MTPVPLEFIDDTLGFNPEWVVDRITPRPILFIIFHAIYCRCW